jgi:hypothetical protein
MYDYIRRFEHRAEQLSVRLEALLEQPDFTRIAMAGVFTVAALCWFAVAWGEGLLLLAIPLVVAACAYAARRGQRERDPVVLGSDQHDPISDREIDAWLNKLTSAPARPDPAPLTRPSFSPEPVSFSVPTPRLEAPAAAAAVEVETPPTLVVPPTPVKLAVDAPEAVEPETTTIYEVREIRAGAPVLLEACGSFDAAVDAAFELIEERDPLELEISRLQRGERETVWSYSREASEGLPRGSLDLFGFDATRWTGTRR